MVRKLTAFVAISIGVAAYLLLRTTYIGATILYPFQLLVTIMHEFGHAAAALITGGNVSTVQINQDGSGVTYTTGGWMPLITAGGYLGSALFGNILLAAGLRYGTWSKYVLYGLLTVMVFIATVWSSSIGNTLFVSTFAVAVYFISRMHDEIIAWFLVFMGSLSVLFVLQDYNIGPSSDLQQFASEVPFLSKTLWMYVWLLIAGSMTFLNVRRLLTE